MKLEEGFDKRCVRLENKDCTVHHCKSRQKIKVVWLILLLQVHPNPRLLNFKTSARCQTSNSNVYHLVWDKNLMLSACYGIRAVTIQLIGSLGYLFPVLYLRISDATESHLCYLEQDPSTRANREYCPLRPLQNQEFIKVWTEVKAENQVPVYFWLKSSTSFEIKDDLVIYSIL